MNAETPALIAGAAGSLLLGSIHLHERRVERAMRDRRIRYRLTFPTGVTEQAVVAALAGLAGAEEAAEFVLEVTADSRGIHHGMAVPDDGAEASVAHLKAAVPGLRTERGTAPDCGVRLAPLAIRVFVPPTALLRTDGLLVSARSLLAGLTDLGEGEVVSVRWAVRPARVEVPVREIRTLAQRDLDRALRSRATEPTFAVSGLLMAHATSMGRVRSLLDGLAQMIRGRHLHGASLRLRNERAGRRMSSLPQTSRRSGRITPGELAGLVGWPLGEEPIPGVEVATRELLVPRDICRDGRTLLIGRDARGERPVALSPAASRLHQLVIGPTGSGKSTVLAQAALSSIAAGEAGLVLDPKDGSLIQSIIERVAPADAERIVVLDPMSAGAIVGLDVFGSGDADARSEALTSTLRAIYAPQGAWGVRSDAYVGLALRSIAVLERPSLLLVGRLFTDSAFRRQVVARLDDPVARMAWSAFENLTSAEQQSHVAAPLNRITGLLRRPGIRGALAQPAPKLNLVHLWQRRGWLMVNLSPAQGEGQARLLGAVASFMAFSALEARAGSEAATRVPTTLIFDELQALADLPTSLERLAERSRGFGGSLVVGTQTASRLPTALADSIFGNFATLMAYRAGAQEAQRLAREFPGLEARDLMGLRPYHVACRLATGQGTGVVTITGRTEPLPAPTGTGEHIRGLSTARYGTPREELDQAFRELLETPERAESRPRPGQTRRQA